MVSMCFLKEFFWVLSELKVRFEMKMRVFVRFGRGIREIDASEALEAVKEYGSQQSPTYYYSNPTWA